MRWYMSIILINIFFIIYPFYHHYKKNDSVILKNNFYYLRKVSFFDTFFVDLYGHFNHNYGIIVVASGIWW